MFSKMFLHKKYHGPQATFQQEWNEILLYAQETMPEEPWNPEDSITKPQGHKEFYQ
jgi:hypothetical protein